MLIFVFRVLFQSVPEAFPVLFFVLQLRLIQLPFELQQQQVPLLCDVQVFLLLILPVPLLLKLLFQLFLLLPILLVQLFLSLLVLLFPDKPVLQVLPVRVFLLQLFWLQFLQVLFRVFSSVLSDALTISFRFHQYCL